tara:strand:+ start:124 stop:507 length:384 start_codon:yes stop_codon:yes gene_type:complete
MKIKNKTTNKNFGIVFCIFFLIISIYPLFGNGEIKIWTLILSLLFLVLGLTNSKILSPLNTIWFKFGINIGKIISPIFMAIVFFLVVTPISLIMKVLGKDILRLKANKKNSYWVEKTGPKSKMKNQF